MKNFKIISHSENDTKNFDKKLDSKISKGDIIVLSRRTRCWENKVYRRLFIIFWLKRRNI